jgi:hypothetical protein
MTASPPITAAKDPRLPPPLAVSDGDDWTEALTLLSPDAAATVVAIVHTLFPHDAVPERVYRRTVLHMDRVFSKSPVAAQLVAEALDALDADLPLPFAERSESYRVASLRKLDGGAAFMTLQRTAVRFFYDDLEVWQAFGYEGAVAHLGGYVNRGFDDLDWLPEPKSPEQGA